MLHQGATNWWHTDKMLCNHLKTLVHFLNVAEWCSVVITCSPSPVMTGLRKSIDCSCIVSRTQGRACIDKRMCYWDVHVDSRGLDRCSQISARFTIGLHSNARILRRLYPVMFKLDHSADLHAYTIKRGQLDTWVLV